MDSIGSSDIHLYQAYTAGIPSEAPFISHKANGLRKRPNTSAMDRRLQSTRALFGLHLGSLR